MTHRNPLYLYYSVYSARNSSSQHPGIRRFVVPEFFLKEKMSGISCEYRYSHKMSGISCRHLSSFYESSRNLSEIPGQARDVNNLTLPHSEIHHLDIPEFDVSSSRNFF